MKVRKGDWNYINFKKKRLGIISAGGLGIVAIIFFIGYFSTGTRNNIMTVFSVLTVLPVAKFIVSFLMLLPHHSVERELYDEVVAHSGEAMVLTDLIITTGEKVLPTQFFVVYSNTVIGFTSNNKYDTAYAEKFIANNLQTNGTAASVKILKEKKQFLNRLDVLLYSSEKLSAKGTKGSAGRKEKKEGEPINTEEKNKQREKDEKIVAILLTLAL